MRVTATTQTTLDRALAGEDLTWDEALWLMGLPVHSADCYALMATANRFTHERSGSRGTVYSQVGINIWPCPENCAFCYLGERHKIVTALHELTPDQVVARALDFEAAGADEVYLMTTANYPLGKFLEIGTEVRRALQPSTDLVANVGDLTTPQAVQLRDAGFSGIYHVYRFRAGIET
jgi:biotin synthase